MATLGCKSSSSRSVSASASTVTLDPPVVVADGVARASVTVKLVDTAGVPYAGQTVQLSASGDGSSVSAPGPTDSTGRTVGGIASTSVGTKTVQVTVNGTVLAQQPAVQFTPPAASVGFKVAPGPALVGSVLAPPVQVQLLDAQGNPAIGSQIAINLSLGNAAGATLAGTLTDLPTRGVVTFPDLWLDQPGAAYTLVAQAAGLPKTTSAPFAVRGFGPGALTGGAVRALVADPANPAVLYAATDVGLAFKYAAGSWTPIAQGLGEPLAALAIDPTKGTLYGAGKSGAWRFDGAAWSALGQGLPTPGAQPYFVAVGQGGLTLAGGSLGAVYRFDGTQWTAIAGPAHTINGLAADAAGVIYVATADAGVLKLASGALTALATTGLAGPAVLAVAVAPTTPQPTLYAGAGDGVYRFDGTASWAKVGTGLPAGATAGLVAVDPTTATTLYAAPGPATGVYRTTDGTTWNPLPALPNAAVTALAFDSGSKALTVATLAGVLQLGSGWTALATGLFAQNVLSVISDPAHAGGAAASTDGAGVYVTTDGASWTALPLGLARPQTSVSALAADPSGAPLYAATAGDGAFAWDGAQWTALGALDAAHANLVALVVDPKSPGTLYAAVHGAGVQKYTSGAWAAVNGGLSGDTLDVRKLAVDASGSASVVYAATFGGVVRLDAGGWTALAALPAGARPISVAVDPAAPGAVFAGTGAGGVYKLAAGAWTVVGDRADFGAPSLVPDGAGGLYAGTFTAGVLHYAGGRWRSASGGLPGDLALSPVLSLARAGGALYAGAAGTVFVLNRAQAMP